jgi:hypothetical protein
MQEFVSLELLRRAAIELPMQSARSKQLGNGKASKNLLT